MWNDYVAQRLSQQHVQEMHAAAARSRLADLVSQQDLEPRRTPRPSRLRLPVLHRPVLPRRPLAGPLA